MTNQVKGHTAQSKPRPYWYAERDTSEEELQLQPQTPPMSISANLTPGENESRQAQDSTIRLSRTLPGPRVFCS